MALRALAVLDIARAIEAITLLPKDELYWGRNHWLPELLTRDPDAVVRGLRSSSMGRVTIGVS